MRRLLGLALLLSVVAGCALRVNDRYDPVTDETVTRLHRGVERFLTTLERQAGFPEGAYEEHAGFYDEMRVELRSLRLRAASRPANEIQVEQVELLLESLDALEELHRTGFQPEQIDSVRTAFDAHFTAILRLELARRREGS